MRMPPRPPTAVGITSTGVEPARESTATQPAMAAAAIITLPIGSRRRSSSPATAASTAMMSSTITVRNNLSAVPKVWIAHSFTGPGVRSMTVDPMAFRASADAPRGAATSALRPRVTAAAAIPLRIRVVAGMTGDVRATRPR